MTSVTRLRNRRTHPRHLTDGQFVAGVDTHKDVHVFAVLDAAGRLVATGSVPTTTGYAALLAHCRRYGELAFVGVEGTSSWGAGLTRFLLIEGVSVLEVERQNRQARRRLGKTDTLDAENAARAVLSGHATTTPKTQDGTIEAIRVLRVTRRGARRARTVAQAQLLSVINTAPQDLRDQLRHLSPTALIVHCARLRPRPVLPADSAGSASVPDATKTALVSLARRIQQLDEEIRELDKTLTRLVKAAAPGLHELHGVGTETAGALLVTAGDNPERLRNCSSFAALCGVSPVSASSGKYQRHRLSRGGDRNANSALWRITLVRMNSHPPTRAYVARRSAEGMSKPEIMRCLKRYIAREIYQHLPRPPAEEATD